MSSTTWVMLALALSLGGALANPSPADVQTAAPVNLRDPTELPPVLRQAPASDGTAGAAAAADIAVQQLMVVEGRYFVVIGGRRLRVGDKLGAARIARIGDSAVWLTEDGLTRKQSLFAGVEKRPERLLERSADPALALKKSSKSAKAAQPDARSLTQPGGRTDPPIQEHP